MYIGEWIVPLVLRVKKLRSYLQYIPFKNGVKVKLKAARYRAAFLCGRLTGFAPVLTLPQSVVLLLHHSLHVFNFRMRVPSVGIEPTLRA